MSQNGWWSTLIVSSWPVFSSIWLAFSQQTEFFTFFYCCHSELLPTLQFWAVIKCTAGDFTSKWIHTVWKISFWDGTTVINLLAVSRWLQRPLSFYWSRVKSQHTVQPAPCVLASTATHWGYMQTSTFLSIQLISFFKCSCFHQREKRDKRSCMWSIAAWLVLVDVILICHKLPSFQPQSTRRAFQQASHFVFQRSDQMADIHQQRHFESRHCVSKLLPSDL